MDVNWICTALCMRSSNSNLVGPTGWEELRVNTYFASKDHSLKISPCFYHLSSLLVRLMFWLLSSLSSPSLLCFVELASIMTESSHYCHHTCWWMYGIDPHVLPRAYEAYVDVMFTGHYHIGWTSLEMLVAFAVVQTTISVFQSGVSSFSCLLISC